MILKTFDGSEFFISDADAEKVAAAINSGVKLVDLRRLNLGWLAPGAIAQIKPGGVDPTIKRLAEPERPLPSPEQLEKNRAEMDNIRKNLGVRYGR